MKTLYVSDLDGTLLASDGLPSRFTADTVNRLVRRGMSFTFATARSLSSASKILPFFDLSVPAVMMNGVFITDTVSGEQKYVCRIEAEAAARTVGVFRENGHAPIVYTYRGGHIDAQFTEIKSGYERNFIAERQKLYHSFVPVKEYELGGDAVYMNCLDEKPVTDKICAGLERIPGIRFSHYLDTYSKTKYFVEAYSENAGKDKTVLRLKEMYGFDRVVAFGDNANDVCMLKIADLAVAVGNAADEVKAAADVTIGTNDDDAVAGFLLDIYEKGDEA